MFMVHVARYGGIIISEKLNVFVFHGEKILENYRKYHTEPIMI